MTNWLFVYHSKPTAGRKYYIDVYAVNTATNASRSYEGTSARAARRRSSKSSGRIVDGRSSRVVLKVSRPEKRFKYQVTGSTAVTVNIYMRSCEVPPQTAVRIQLERQSDDEVLATHAVNKSFEALSVSSLVPGTYRLKVSIAGGSRLPKGSRYRWTVLMSTGNRSPYPRLPADARVRLATDDCRSATVAWSLPSRATSELQRYCIMVEPVTSTSGTFNACANPRRRRRKSAKMSCHVTGNEESGAARVEERGDNETMMQTISGMKRGRRYAVDVYASTAQRTTKEFLAYERLIVDVPSTC